MATQNLDEVNLSAVEAGGQVHEALLQRLIDISPMDLVMVNSFGEGESLGNNLEEWVEEDLAAADPENKTIDGQETGFTNAARTGLRFGNYHQQPVKIVSVSDRANSVNSVGSGRNELRKQLPKRLREIRRDVESRISSTLPAAAGNGTTTEGECAGVGAWLGAESGIANSSRGSGGVDPILNGGTNSGGVPTIGAVAGTARPLSMSIVDTLLQTCWNEGGNPTMACARAPVIKLFSDYMFDSTARVATLRTDADAGNRTNVSSGGGVASGGIVAQGSVNVYVGNFATLTMAPSRYQPTTGTDRSDLYLIDPDLWELCYLSGYRTKELSTTGLAENRMVTCDFTLRSLAQRGSAVFADVDETTAAVA